MDNIHKDATVPITPSSTTSLLFSWLLRTRRSKGTARNSSDGDAVMVDCVVLEDETKRRASEHETSLWSDAQQDLDPSQKITAGCSSSHLRDHGANAIEPVRCQSVPGAFRISPNGIPPSANFEAMREC